MRKRVAKWLYEQFSVSEFRTWEMLTKQGRKHWLRKADELMDVMLTGPAGSPGPVGPMGATGASGSTYDPIRPLAKAGGYQGVHSG